MKSLIYISTLWILVLISSCNKIITGTIPLVDLSTDAPTITVSNVTASEEAGTASFTVSLDHAYAGSVQVSYALTAHNADQVEDFTVSDLKGLLTFTPGQMTKTIPVVLHDDLISENAETISIDLMNAVTGTLANASAVMTITDVDTNFFGADVLSLNQITGPARAPSYKFTTSNTLVVDPVGGPGSYSTIQDAVDDAVPGTEILVNNGVYPEAVTFSSKGDVSGLPILLKANTGHSPVLTGAEEISSGSVFNTKTDGDEFGPHTLGFETGVLSDFFNTELGTSGLNTASITSAESLLGVRSVLLGFGGTSSVSTVWNSFNGWSTFNSGDEYRARVAFKLNSTFVLNGLNTQGLVIMRVENDTDASAQRFMIKMMRTATAGEFSLTVVRSGLTATTTVVPFVRGNWVTLDMYYKKSTTAPAADGIFRLKVNGNNAVVGTHDSIATHNRFRLGSPTEAVGCPATGTYACPAAGSFIAYDAVRIEESDYMPIISDNMMDTVYENGMESGLADFSSTIDSTNSLATSTAEKWDGSQSVKMSFAGTSAQNSLRNTFAPMDDTYARVAFRLNSSFDLTEEADKVNSPSGTEEYVREFDLISLHDSTVSSGRLKVSLLKRGARFFIMGKILNALNTSQASLSWGNDTNISDYLLIYKGHLGEINKNTWNTLEIRYAGGRALEGGVEIWLNGISIAANINRTTNKYDGISTKGLRVNTVELGTYTDVNTGGASRQTMQTTAPTNGSEIFFDGLKVTSGVPAGLTATGVTPDIYKYSYSIPGAGEGAPSSLIINNKVLTPVAFLSVVAPGTFFVDTANRFVYFRMPDDAAYTTQKVYSGRRNTVLIITDSSNIVIQNLNIQNGNHEETGCIHMVNANGVKVIGNNMKGCNGPAIRVQDTWNGANRSSDILISGNSFIDNGKVFGGGVRLDHMGNINIENNFFDSSSGNGIDADCTYDISVAQKNVTTNFCTNITIARNIFSKSVESAIYLTSNTNNSRVYSNIITATRESGYGTQTTAGKWKSSGGSGIHIARGGHNNVIYNNLIYDIDRAGIALRAAAIDNIVFNNTIAETGAYIVAGGASMDFQRDYNEVNDDHNYPTKNNVSYNNIYSYTYGTSPCVDIDGYHAGGAPPAGLPANGPDIDNMSNNNIFFGCSRAGKFNATSYPVLANLVAATGASWAARENNSQVYSGTLFTDALNDDYSTMTGSVFTAIPYDIKTYMP